MRGISVAGGSRQSDRAERLDAIVGEHFDLVWRVLRRLGASPADADDAVQEVFLVAARRLDAIEPGRERAFLIGVAMRVFSTQRRSIRRRREQTDSFPDDLATLANNPLESLELRRARALLDEALASLSLELRTVIVLYEFEQLSVGEIAELLATPRGTVSWRLKSARAAFSAATRRLQARNDHPKRSS